MLIPGLYIVSTPIGNLEDITYRAVKTLAQSDVIFCEDSRVTKKLLSHYGISTSLNVYNDQSDQETRNFIEKLILGGKVVSLVSDSGTPLISDPGYKLVKYLMGKSIKVDHIPGPSSIIAGQVLSGLPTDNFYFGGFIPKNKNQKISFFKNHINIKSTLIYFESSKRIASSIEVAKDVFGNIEACVVREITKLYQEVNKNDLNTLSFHYNKTQIKGEIVLLISNILPKENVNNLDLQIKLFKDKGFSNKEIRELLKEKQFKGLSSSFIYKRIINID